MESTSATPSLAEPRVSAPVRLVETMRRGLMGAALGTVVLNVSAAGLGFVVTVTLTRVLGAEGYGAYAFAFAWAMILAVPAVLGLTPLLVRNVAAYRARSSWALMRGMLRRCNQSVAAISLALVLVGAAVGWLSLRSRPELLHPYLAGLALIPLIGLTSLRQAALQGLGRVVLGRVPETVLAPLLLVALVVALGPTVGLSATGAIGLQVAALAVAFAAGAWLLRRSLPSEVKGAVAEYETRTWVRSALPFLLMSGIGAVTAQVGVVVLGHAEGATAAGIYAAASRTALLASFLWLAASYPLMPACARLHAQGDRAGLERVLVRFGVVALSATLPLVVVLLVFGEAILGIFGDGFTGATWALRILVLGELSRVLMGFAGLGLAMTGHERAATVALGIGAGLTLVLTIILVPIWGIEGAAVGVAVGTAVTNGIAVYLLRRKVGIYAAPMRRSLQRTLGRGAGGRAG